MDKALYDEEVRNSYLIREMSECPAALVTMLISVSGLGSTRKTKIIILKNNKLHRKSLYYGKRRTIQIVHNQT